MKPKKKAGAALSRKRTAVKRMPRVKAKEAERVAVAGEWTPLMEERREGGGPQDGVDSRREVDRAKEDKGNEDESGGPDA
jgi:hypothetical protein